MSSESGEIGLVFSLAGKITELYDTLHISPTVTLVSKVMLGATGCIPAYDTFFYNGLKFWNMHIKQKSKPKIPLEFDEKSYCGLIDFYQENKDSIKETNDVLAEQGFDYPVMKLIDMYFWNLGFQDSIKKDN